MQTKYFKPTQYKDQLYTVTETQLRDLEIVTSYMMMIKMGEPSLSAIRHLADDYSLSIKNIERIVYPIPK
jgi:hypothetical protein